VAGGPGRLSAAKCGGALSETPGVKRPPEGAYGYCFTWFITLIRYFKTLNSITLILYNLNERIKVKFSADPASY